MKVVFIDPSIINVGWCIFETGQREVPQAYGYYKTRAEGNERYREVLRLAKGYFLHHYPGIEHAVIEWHPHFRFHRFASQGIRNQRTLDTLKRATQCIVDGFVCCGIPVEEWHTRWKRNRKDHQIIHAATLLYQATVGEVAYNGPGRIKTFPSHTADALMMADDWLTQKRYEFYEKRHRERNPGLFRRERDSSGLAGSGKKAR